MYLLIDNCLLLVYGDKGISLYRLLFFLKVQIIVLRRSFYFPEGLYILGNHMEGEYPYCFLNADEKCEKFLNPTSR